jgi:hypothetical protein
VFTTKEKQQIESCFGRLYDEATSEMCRPATAAGLHETVHYSLWVSDVDKVVWLWYASLIAYCMTPRVREMNCTISFQDYRKSFCGGYANPHEFMQARINFHVTEFLKEHQREGMFDYGKIISSATETVEQSFQMMDTAWLANELRCPQLNPMDMCLIFRK